MASRKQFVSLKLADVPIALAGPPLVRALHNAVKTREIDTHLSTEKLPFLKIYLKGLFPLARILPSCQFRGF